MRAFKWKAITKMIKEGLGIDLKEYYIYQGDVDALYYNNSYFHEMIFDSKDDPAHCFVIDNNSNSIVIVTEMFGLMDTRQYLITQSNDFENAFHIEERQHGFAGWDNWKSIGIRSINNMKIHMGDKRIDKLQELKDFLEENFDIKLKEPYFKVSQGDVDDLHYNNVEFINSIGNSEEKMHFFVIVNYDNAIVITKKISRSITKQYKIVRIKDSFCVKERIHGAVGWSKWEPAKYEKEKDVYNKKYRIVKGYERKINGIIIHRIQALKDFGDLKAGDLGGWIENESNLSQEGNCWVYPGSVVCRDSVVQDNAKIAGDSIINEHCFISDNAHIRDGSMCCGKSVGQPVIIRGKSSVSNSDIFGHVKIWEGEIIKSIIRGYNGPTVIDSGFVIRSTCIENDGQNILKIGDGAGRIIGGKITKEEDYLLLKGLGSANRLTTFYRGKKNDIQVKCGCFKGSISEFEQKVMQTYELDTLYSDEYLAAALMAKIHFGEKTIAQIIKEGAEEDEKEG